MLFARAGELELGRVLPTDLGADVPLPAVYRAPLPSPVLPPAYDQQVVMDPVRSAMYLGMGSAIEEFQTGEIKTTTPTSSNLDRIKAQATSLLQSLPGSESSGSLVPVDVVAPSMTTPTSSGTAPSQDASARALKAYQMLLNGDIETLVAFIAGKKIAARREIFSYLKPRIDQASYDQLQSMVKKARAEAGLSFWDKSIVGPVTVKHVAIGAGVLVAAGVALRLILR